MSSDSETLDAVSPETWARVSEIFDRALEIPPSELKEWLDEACAGDDDVRREVEALLAADMQPATLLDRGAADAASTLVARVEAGERDAQDQHWIDQELGPYRVIGILGQGGMGTVLLAERADGQFEERVALKVLRCCTTSDELLRRFRQERQILARLRHPSIASLLHGGVTDDGEPYFAMEHVNGLPITQFCDRQELGIEKRLELLNQVIEGVQHAHRNLVIHRDLKPSNILVTAEGKVRLLDFGIAKLLDADVNNDQDGHGDATTQTQILTPQYAAPEQLTGHPVTTATDVYALGVLLYELLTGELPFDNAYLGALEGGEPEWPSRQVLKGEKRSGLDAGALSRQLAGDLDAITLKALRLEPEHRYPTPGALAEDLRRHLDGQTVRARRSTWRYRARKFVTRNRASVVAAALFVLALVAGLAGTAWQAAEARRATVRAEKEAEVAKQVADFLATTFSSADPSRAGIDDVTARDLLDAAALRIEEELAEAPQIQARLLGVLGVIYRRLSLYEESRPFLERALALRRENVADNPEVLANSLFSLAMLERDLGKYDEAESLFQEALALRRSTPGDGSHVAISLHGLGGLLLQTKRTEEGVEMLQEALEITQRVHGTEDPRALDILSNLIFVHLDEGRREIAKPLLRDLLERQRAVHGNAHPAVTKTLHNLATIAWGEDRLEEAESVFREVLAIERQLYDEPHSDIYGTLGWLGHTLHRQGKLEEAELCFREALEVIQAAKPPEHRWVGSGLMNLGWILIELGRPEEAETYLRRSVANLLSSRGEDYTRTQEARLHLGRALLAMDDLPEAEILLRSAYARLRELRDNDEHRTVVLARGAVEELDAVLAAAKSR